jgi:hypothetical protein
MAMQLPESRAPSDSDQPPTIPGKDPGVGPSGPPSGPELAPADPGSNASIELARGGVSTPTVTNDALSTPEHLLAGLELNFFAAKADPWTYGGAPAQPLENFVQTAEWVGPPTFDAGGVPLKHSSPEDSPLDDPYTAYDLLV